MDEDLVVNDAVWVARDAKSRQLEGVVAYVGTVEFADGRDWVGVRLTGSSVGQGKNDGTVQGRSYFQAPPHSGLFVRAQHIKRRQLTRLEELRLRRELAGAGSAAAAAAPAPAAAAAAPTTPGAKPQSKLEELRARRAALQQEKKQQQPGTPTAAATAPAPAAASSAIPAASAAVAAANTAELEKKYQAKQQELEGQIKQLQTQSQQWKEEKEAQEKRANGLQQQLQHTQDSLLQLEQRAKHEERATMSEALQQEYNAMQHGKEEAEEKLQEANSQIKRLQTSLKQEQEAHAVHLDELTLARTQATTWQKEYQAVTAQSSKKTTTEANTFKERARFQAELAHHEREKASWQQERADLEATVEELTLDKDQLLEEKESLEDKVEELKLDAETASMEVEELKLELEDARQAADAAESSGGADSDTAEEKIRALSVQNARLREALIRLREQTTVEKMEQHKQLRAAEKEVEDARRVTKEVENLRALKVSFEEQINDLKDMVEQGAAFEGMVEDLSDRVLSLEEDNIALQTTIREMEEGADLMAEVEEVQAEELKAFTRDLEGRDAIIHNLEEAIKMQRRREDDFRRTVGNYRTTVELLKQEKQALLELQQGGAANTSHVLASSQKALARAAQLVSDAAELRRQSAQHSFDDIDRVTYLHLSRRLEEMLPNSLVAAEVAAIKGELVTSKVVGIASKSLQGIVQSFGKVIKPALPVETSKSGSGSPKSKSSKVVLKLSDDAKQEAATMFHQTEYGHVLVDVSADLRRLLAAGQWPDLVSTEVSMELGSILGHAVADLDNRLSVVLKQLKEEGVLTPEQSNLEALQQSIQATMQRLQSDIEREDAVLIPPQWQPPAWKLLTDASTARFSCLGATAALSSVLNQPEYTASDDNKPPEPLLQLYNRMEQASTQATNACLRLANLDVQNTSLVSNLTDACATWKLEAASLMKSMQDYLLNGQKDLSACEMAATSTLRSLAKLLAALRSAQLNPTESGLFHALSPEDFDYWKRLLELVRAVRAVDGDPEDVHATVRVRELERHLEQVLANEPRLEQSEAKVAQLEKTLSTKTKEIAMTNARLSELEKQLAKTNTSSSSGGAIPRSRQASSAKEFNSLKEENRVLTEAMDVLQRQVDEYENEIRSLKDLKTPHKRGGHQRGTPRRAITSIADLASPSSGRDEAAAVSPAGTGALEATIFRPALANALRDAARWKSAAVESALADLPPLVTGHNTAVVLSSDDKNAIDAGILARKKESAYSDLVQLNAALSQYRLDLVQSAKLVDLSSPLKSPRQQLREQKQLQQEATQNLQYTVNQCRQHLYGQ